MNIHEYKGVELFKAYGIPVPENKLVTSLERALDTAKLLGFPLVLKAQVLTGGRGKAGGVKRVNNINELQNMFPQVLGMDIKGFKVNKILIVKAIDFVSEVYLGATLDRSRGKIVCIASSAGGVEIEEVAKKSPGKIFKLYIDIKRDLEKNKLKEFLKPIFSADDIDCGASVLAKLIKLFIEKDSTLVEINPFVKDKKDEWIAADAKINFDDNALYRHPEIEKLRDLEVEDPDEVFAKKSGLSFVKLDGEIGCIVNGAGLAMATMDVIKNMGGRPLNFLDVGGSSNPNKVINALKIILKNNKVKAILINIFGGITRCDDVANGIIEAYNQIKIDVPIVVRLTGTNEEKARELLSKKGIITYTDMKEAVERVIAL